MNKLSKYLKWIYEQLAKKEEKRTDISNLVQIGSAWTQQYKYVTVTSKMVHFEIEAYVPGTFVANTEYTIATVMNTAYRPSRIYGGRGYATDSNYNPTAVVSVMAKPDGTIKVRTQNTTGRYFWISGDYFTN